MTVLQASSYIFTRYNSLFGKHIDEMKLHKLLYFAQRESLIQNKSLLFAEEFEGWKYGPVMYCVRNQYAMENFSYADNLVLSSKEKKVFDFVFMNYAIKDSWSLSRLSHGEYSWIKSRKGLKDDENGGNKILNSDIEKDAQRIRTRRVLLSLNV